MRGARRARTPTHGSASSACAYGSWTVAAPARRWSSAAPGPSVEGLLDLALVLHLAGDVGGEVTACERANAARADDAAAWARYAHALARTDRVSDAVAAWGRALTLNRGETKVTDLLARLRAANLRGSPRLSPVAADESSSRGRQARAPI